MKYLFVITLLIIFVACMSTVLARDEEAVDVLDLLNAQHQALVNSRENHLARAELNLRDANAIAEKINRILRLRELVKEEAKRKEEGKKKKTEEVKMPAH